MELKVTTEGDKATIAIEGKLTVQTSPDLEAAIALLEPGIAHIDIDLTKVSYVSSAGLRVLVGADKLTTSRGGGMRIIRPCTSVREVFDMTGLSQVLKIEE